MKTKKTLIISLIAAVCSGLFFSCEGPIGLGEKLDIQGPVVEFTSPKAGQAVKQIFTIEGTASDRTGVKEMLLKAEINNNPFAKQWRYNGDIWEEQINSGSWTPVPGLEIEGVVQNAQWNGTNKSASWKLPINMKIGDQDAEEGRYLFILQAWDTAGFTDDNSFKTLELVYDKDPPKVEVFNPFLYDKSQCQYNSVSDEYEFSGALKSLVDAVTWKEPSLIGKFLVQEFPLQWQIEDQNDIWSIELLFYKHDAKIDGIGETPVPDDYIYYYHENLPPPALDPSKNIKPTGSVMVPDLGGPTGQYDGGGILKETLDDKTVIKVVSICYDAAGWVNQEKVLGYFIFWPQASEPWITYTEGMEESSVYIDNNRDEAFFKADAFMIYPGRNIRATAFQTQGVSKVEFTIHNFTYSTETTSWTISGPIDLGYMQSREGGENTEYANPQKTRVIIRNPPRPNDSFSTIFTWDFMPLAKSANYVVRAQAYDSNGKTREEPYEATFRVQDITFPDFPKLPYPAAGEPLFKFINRPNDDPNYTTPAPVNSITISGVVADATEIESLYMVWINPGSRNYAAMSQLSYFRDASYVGWTKAIAAPPSQVWPMEETEYDTSNPNKVWKVPIDLSSRREDPDTQRIWFNYSLTINLSTLNIGINDQPLISQVFLLRAENPDKKSTIITYAPQGDTISPTLTIESVSISGGTRPASYEPGEYAQVPRFEGTETITVQGRWTEDSTEYLNNQTYFYNNMSFTINNIPITGTAGSGTTVTINPTNPSANVTEGTFTLTANVGAATGGSNIIRTTDLRDTLVVNAKASDIGGNPVEAGASWLIESDTLRFLRISSEKEDKAYKAGEKIEIFLEFNKPVRLKPNRSQDPVLVLNTTGGVNARAYYNEGQASESTRHFFTYTVAADQNTPTNQNLNVSGISIVGGVPDDPGHNPNNNTPLAANAASWQDANYPFTFVHTNIANVEEEIRLTTATAHRDNATGNGVLVNVTGQTEQVWARVVPVTTTSTDSDYKFTLIGGKRISIDNTPPILTSIEVTPTGWHKQGVDIYITATFSKPVRVERNSYDAPGLVVTRPQLILGYLNGNEIGRTSNSADDVRVNNTKITFRYTVGNVNTITNPLQVIGLAGDILDVPGTRMTTIATTTLTGAGGTGNVYLDNIVPAVPTVTVHGANTNSGNTPSTGNRQNPVPATLYYDYGSIQIAGVTGDQNLGRVEYTLNGHLPAAQQTWTSVTTATHNITLVNRGDYNIKARQTDRAGNVSDESSLIAFTWDPGSLVTRITSSVPNQTYTHKSIIPPSTTQPIIPITIYFRKSIDISEVTGITLNVLQSNGTPITLTNSAVTLPVTNVNSLTFNYTVTNGDRMPNPTNLSEWLNVTNLGTITATDRAATSTTVTTFITMPTDTSMLLGGTNGQKQIRVATGDLSNPNPTFIADADGGTGWNNEADANFHGIRSDDGSYWTTLQIQFNQNISKGEGNIKIEQIAIDGTNAATAYRLPVVLTETQYNRFRGIEDFSTYYTKGTNGYIPGSGNNPTSATSRSDTSTKYVLNYNYNPNSGRGGNPVFTNDALPDGGFFTAFREAEGISLSVNSQAVTIVNNNTLRVRLSGSNAPQVPGATYLISYPAGLVTDDLGNSSAAKAVNVTLRGVAKPFIRIKKTQDIISAVVGDGSATQPRLTAAQPQYAYVRMDGRTPGSSITYWTSTQNYTANATNWNTGGTPASTTNANRPTLTNTGTPYNPQPTPAIDNPYGIRIGNTTHEGLKYWIVARATHNSVDSFYSDEMAYRTAITFRLQGIAVTGTTAHDRMQEGDQIWVRGGDSIGSSSIPGFPLTFEDDWDSLKGTPTTLNPNPGRRAGIRLMTLLAGSVGTNMGTTDAGSSTWQFLTWEINATAYIDIILGHDRNQTNINNYDTYESASVNEIWQYGPRYWALLRGGWANQKALYPVYAGEIRYLATNVQNGTTMNFSAAFNQRPSGGTNGVAGWSVTVPSPNTN